MNAHKEQNPVGPVPSPGALLPYFNLIRDHIAATASIDTEDFDYTPFVQRRGLGKAHQLFGERLPKLLEELNQVLTE